MHRVRLFVSHRSTDKKLAKAVADLLRSAGRLKPGEIRCSSVDGYRLPGGADTAAQLREEVLGADALVGLVTPSAMSSAYVLFELGARWGAGKYLCPALGRGADDKMLGGPLGGKNALHLTARAEVVQLVEEVTAVLNHSIESWTSLQHNIDDVVRLASEIDTESQTTERPSSAETTIDDNELKILMLLASTEDSKLTSEQIASALGLKLERARYHMRRLESANVVDFVENWGTGERYYSLDQTGREFLVKRDLL